MGRQIRYLSGVQLVNLFGINEIRHTKDKRKKARYLQLAVVWLVLLILFVTYIVGFSQVFVKTGMAETIPACLFALTAVVMLVFTFFKAGSVIFQMKTYEVLISLPVSKAAIVISRFLTMYVTNLALGFLVMLPGMAVYSIAVRPGAAFYVFAILGTLLLPLLPLSIATALGAGITAISSRMRHKSLVSATLAILLALAAIVGSMGLSGGAEQTDASALQNIALLAGVLEEQIGRIYPPAIWFANAVARGEVSAFLLLLAVSAGVFAALVWILQKFFQQICSALNATTAKNNYHMKTLTTNAPLTALWKRELKRYFASSIYVTNTIIGYVLMAVMAVGLYFAGIEKIEALLGILEVTETVFPFLLALCAVIMPPTTSAVSMEGRQWWIAQTLPVKGSSLWNAKLLVNLTVATPFYLLAVVFGALALKPSPTEGIWIAVIPLVYILFSSVVGLAMNLAMPVFEWDNEVHVIKQSASALLTMLVCFVTVVIPPALLFLCGRENREIVLLFTVVILALAAAAVYLHNYKKQVILY